MARIYVSGPMRRIKDFNAPAFHAAAEALQAAGHEVFDPAAHDEIQGFDLTSPDGLDTPVGFDLREALGADMAWITALADGVAVLPGWVDSMGAKAEVATARALGLPVDSVERWVERARGEYVPAIGDRVRIVDADWTGHRDKPIVGIVTELDCGDIYKEEKGYRVHPIGVLEEGYGEWHAVEVELIKTAAEIESDRAIGDVTAALDDLAERAQAEHDWLHMTAEGDGVDRRAFAEIRVTSATGGEKGRKLAELGGIDPQALLTLAEVSGMGARKYSTWNYLKGYDWSLSFNAMQRHALAFWAGQDNDDESGLPHVAHAAWHCLALLAFLQRDIGTDDRFNQKGV